MEKHPSVNKIMRLLPYQISLNFWYFKILCILLVYTKGKAQDPPIQEIDIHQLIQSLLPVANEDVDHTDLYDALIELYHNPVQINSATFDELAATYVLSETQINGILKYRAEAGSFLSLYELQAIPELNLETIRSLLPFIVLEKVQPKLKNTLKNPTQHFLIFRSSRLAEKLKGYTDIDSSTRSTSRYVGSPLNAYLRYRYARTGVYSIGINIEKDAGEKWWYWKPSKQIFGPDFTSLHFQILNRGKLRNLILGDFQLQIGQGLILGAGFTMGKGSEVIRTTYRSTIGIRPYTSALEANFFRGVAATFQISKQLQITSFYSRIKRDVSYPTDEDLTTVSSLPISGFHRTPLERLKQNIIQEHNIGFHIHFKPTKSPLQIGVTALHTQYSLDFAKRELPYNLFEFTGNQNFIFGAQADYRWKNFHIFSEAAQSKSKGLGWVTGLIAGLGKNLDFTMLLRHYDRHFHSFYGNPFAESSRPINENGRYIGIKYSPFHRLQISFFYDNFKFPWLKYQINKPSDGNQFYAHAVWKPNKRFNIYSMVQQKNKFHNFSQTTSPITPVVNTIRNSALINFEYNVPMKYTLRTRIQTGNFRYEGQSKSSGIALVQDITYHLKKWEVSGRIAFFNTDNYDSRQYVYEKDVLYAFSIPAYYDVGTRHYLLTKYSVTQKMKIWVRWSQTRYKNIEKISSGLNEIVGNKRSEIKVQMMYQL